VFDISEEQRIAGWSPVTGGNLDASRLRALGWEPQVGLPEGVRGWVQFLESE
jgi:nucleoside-diphosphate-sugar epimerase